MTAQCEADVVIVGGGPAGLLLAHRLGRIPCLRVVIVEARPPEPPLSDDELDLRVSALSPRSLELLSDAGCLADLPPLTVCDYTRMRVWQDNAGPTGPHAIEFSAAELGVPRLGCIVENRALRVALWQGLERLESCEQIIAAPERLTECRDAIVLRAGDNELRARLVVAADGARSWVRAQFGIASREHSHAAAALVAHLATTRPHDHTAWQKFLPEGPMALLPLADGRVSLVWSHPAHQTEALLNLADEDFGSRLSRAMDGVLGELTCTTPRAAFPLLSAHAERYTGRRVALVGDAAHRVHPLAGQGANLGLLDAAALAEVLEAHMQMPWADPGDPVALRRYERARKGDNAVTLGTMMGLDSLFRSPLAGVAGAGMGLVDRIRPVKALLARRAMGTRVR